MKTEQLARSFFSLVKYNGGQFKSAKQASFLSRFLENGTLTYSASMTFGDYEGRTERNTRSVLWVFHTDSVGVTKVTRKGELWWERTEESMAKSRAACEEREYYRRRNLRQDNLSRRLDKVEKIIGNLSTAFFQKTMPQDMAVAKLTRAAQLKEKMEAEYRANLLD